MVVFLEESIDIELGKEFIIIFIFKNIDSGKFKDKMFCKFCGVMFWIVFEYWK